MGQPEDKEFDGEGILRQSGAEKDDPGMDPPSGVEILGPVEDKMNWLLSNAVLDLFSGADQAFGEIARGLSDNDAGQEGGPDTQDWRVAANPEDGLSRRVSIAGPACGPALIRGLNSSADAYIASFDAFLAPTWTRLLEGQSQLHDAVSGILTDRDPVSGAFQSMSNLTPPELILRPRPLSSEESHVVVNGNPLPAGFFDVIVFAKHNVNDLVHGGGGLRLSLSALQSVREAELWSAFLKFLTEELSLEEGDIQVTVEVGTTSVVEHLDDYLWALRDYVTAFKVALSDFLADLSRREEGLSSIENTEGPSQGVKALCEYLVFCAHRRGALALGPLVRGYHQESSESAVPTTTVYSEWGLDGVSVVCPEVVSSVRSAIEAVSTGANRMDVAGTEKRPVLSEFTGQEMEETQLGHRLGVGLQFLGNWLVGRDHFVSEGRVESIGSIDCVRLAAWKWDENIGAGDGEGKRSTARALLSAEVGRLRSEMGDDAFRDGGLGQARTILRRAIGAEDLTQRLGERAYGQLDKLLR